MVVRLVVFAGLLAVVAMTNEITKKSDNEIKKTKQNIDDYISTTTVKHRDCHQWRLAGARKTGVYVIYPNGTYPVKVHCEHGVNISSTVIQRRMNGQINFHTTWYYYKTGFGSYVGDYWAGLDNIYYLTAAGNSRLTVKMQDWSGNNRQVHYNHFQVQGEATGYRMHVSGFTGNVPDSLTYHNGMQFATPDKPDYNSCAINMHAGWWFSYCAFTLPNGIYYKGGPYTPSAGYYDGIYWKDWLGFGYSLKFISMTITH